MPANTEHDALVPPPIYSEAEGGLVREFLSFAAFIADDPPMNQRKVSARMVQALAAALTTIAAENARLLAFASSLADRDDSIGDDARAALNHEGPNDDR